MRPWRLATCSLLVVLPWSGAVAQAIGPAPHGAVLLRYHYVAGESFTYALSSTTRSATIQASAASATPPAPTPTPLGPGPSTPQVTATSVLGKPVAGTTPVATGGPAATTSGSLTRAIVRYQVLSVDRHGAATMRVTTTHQRTLVTTAGRTTTRVQPTVSITITMSPDGRGRALVSSGALAINVQAGITLPAGPVSPGARWTTVASSTLPTVAGIRFPPLHVTTRNLFVGYVTTSAGPAALIRSASTLAYTATLTFAGYTIHLRENGTTVTDTRLGLTAGRVLSDTTHSDMIITTQVPSPIGHAMDLRQHSVTDSSLSPAPPSAAGA